MNMCVYTKIHVYTSNGSIFVFKNAIIYVETSMMKQNKAKLYCKMNIIYLFIDHAFIVKFIAEKILVNKIIRRKYFPGNFLREQISYEFLSTQDTFRPCGSWGLRI